jgi:undecaprenyl-diphosphatase
VRSAPPGHETAADGGRASVDVPGRHDLGPIVERFDEAVDLALERLRGRPVLDRVFRTASHVGDFSLVWHTINVLMGIRHRRPRQVVTFAMLIGVESLVVNQGVKRLFRRPRPTVTGEDGLRVRQPTTSSFPSGHASAATFAAGLLARRAGWPLSIAIRTSAAVVGMSRAYVRIHHASDVAAGFITGAALLTGTRRLATRFGANRMI